METIDKPSERMFDDCEGVQVYPTLPQASYNNSRSPSDDRTGICAMLFRKGTKSTEADFQPDMDLVYEMRDRGIRVQDLMNYIRFGPGAVDLKDLIAYWGRREY